jgi:glycosyltransferase involved in cell wall biosynthesis
MNPAVAVLIASHNGSGSIEETIASVRDQGAHVFVVSDGSSDDTVARSRRAGAYVLELERNFGKPGAILRALFVLRLWERYEAIAILDDDTLVASGAR